MAEIVLSNATFYMNGISGVSGVVGNEAGGNRVVRYTMTSPATGASNVALSFVENWREGGTIPETLRFYIGTSATSHENAGSSSEYTGTLTRSTGEYPVWSTYSGSADVVLLPNATYYVWVLVLHSFASATTPSTRWCMLLVTSRTTTSRCCRCCSTNWDSHGAKALCTSLTEWWSFPRVR